MHIITDLFIHMNVHTILYSEADNILVSEWLEQYVPLSHFFNFTPLPDSKPVSGDGKTSTVPILDVDSDTYRYECICILFVYVYKTKYLATE